MLLVLSIIVGLIAVGLWIWAEINIWADWAFFCGILCAIIAIVLFAFHAEGEQSKREAGFSARAKAEGCEFIDTAKGGIFYVECNGKVEIRKQ